MPHVHDPKLARLYVRALALLQTAPTGAGGAVEIFRYFDPAGRPTYVVNQFSNNGGWASPETYSLAVAELAAEMLALANGAALHVCRECDEELEQ